MLWIWRWGNRFRNHAKWNDKIAYEQQWKIERLNGACIYLKKEKKLYSDIYTHSNKIDSWGQQYYWRRWTFSVYKMSRAHTEVPLKTDLAIVGEKTLINVVLSWFYYYYYCIYKSHANIFDLYFRRGMNMDERKLWHIISSSYLAVWNVLEYTMHSNSSSNSNSINPSPLEHSHLHTYLSNTRNIKCILHSTE